MVTKDTKKMEVIKNIKGKELEVGGCHTSKTVIASPHLGTKKNIGMTLNSV